MRFTKMQGCGNDYVYVNCFKENVENPEVVARFLSDRHFGIGADGLILIKPSQIADCKMEMYNLDGSMGAMCGNGIRCVAKYVHDYKILDKTSIAVETESGIKHLTLELLKDKVHMVTVDMGEPITKPLDVPVVSKKEIVLDEPVNIDGRLYHLTCVSMGNPHAVTFVEDTQSLNLLHMGPLFEYHSMFPQRVNTEFVQIIDKNTINMRVWERGSGETLACGTGACASVYASILNGKTEDEVLVHLLGGDLKIRYDKASHHIFMTGPATVVFDGEIDIRSLGGVKDDII